jgi:probable HAF family extracellular repeat protein
MTITHRRFSMRAHQQLSTLLLLALFGAPLAAGADPRYALTVLAGAGSAATDINNAGQVAGRLHDGAAGQRGFLYSAGTVAEVGTFGGATSTAYRINARGQLVGAADTADSYRGFIYSGGSMTELGTLGGAYSTAQGINDAGTVVGGAAYGGSQGGLLARAFIYSNGTLQNIGTLPNGDQSDARDINSAGQVVGRSAISTDNPPEHPFHAFLYQHGEMTDLGTLGGIFSSAAAINEAGQIVGYASTPRFRVDHAFLFSAGVMHDLGTFGDDPLGDTSEATDINNLGQVVGSAWRSGFQHAFLYEGGGLLDLNALIDPAGGWTVQEAGGINDRQQIAATACKDGDCFAVRLDPTSPVPEAAGYAMLVAGFGLLGLLRRRA